MAKQAAAGFAVVALALLAYSNSFDAGVSLDGATVILKDPRVQEATARNLGLIFSHSYYWPSGEAGLYRPLTTLSYLLSGSHAVNFLLHAANALLVYALALRLTGKLAASMFIAGIWAVHPVQTEAVTNIAGRADLLAALGVLGGFWAYLKSLERRVWLAGVAAGAAIGAFSKESGVALVGVILLYEIAWWKGRTRTLLYGCAAALVPVAAMLFQRSRVLEASLPSELPFVDNPIAYAGFLTGRLTALKVCARYLGLIVWPGTLSADYSYGEIPMAHGSTTDWIAWLAVAAFLATLAWLWRRDRTMFFFAAFAVVCFLPTANLLFPTGSIMAERFLYLPSVGVIGAAVLGIFSLTPRRAPAVLCAIAAVLAVRTYARNADWQSELSIVTAGVQAAPDSFKLHQRLAELLFPSGDLNAAIDQGEKSLAILDPVPDARNVSEAYRAAGGYYLVEGDLLRQQNQDASGAYARALEILKRAAAIQKSVRAAYEPRLKAWESRGHSVGGLPGKDESATYQMLAAVYGRLGDGKNAANAAGEALALHPQTADAYRQIAYTFLSEDRRGDAAKALIMGVLATSAADLAAEVKNSFGDDCAALVAASQSGLDPESRERFARERGCKASP